MATFVVLARTLRATTSSSAKILEHFGRLCELLDGPMFDGAVCPAAVDEGREREKEREREKVLCEKERHVLDTGARTHKRHKTHSNTPFVMGPLMQGAAR